MTTMVGRTVKPPSLEVSYLRKMQHAMLLKHNDEASVLNFRGADTETQSRERIETIKLADRAKS